MGIPIGKLALYTLCAGIHPATTLPIVLDVGTNNQALLDDPLYLGWRHRRVSGADYDAFVDAFVRGIMRRFPARAAAMGGLRQAQRARGCWRGIATSSARSTTTFKGTGAVTLAGLLSAMAVTGQRLGDQRIVILGAGSAAIGISDQIVAAMMGERTVAQRCARRDLAGRQRGRGPQRTCRARRGQAAVCSVAARASRAGGLIAGPIALACTMSCGTCVPASSSGHRRSLARSPRPSSVRWRPPSTGRSSSRCRIRPRRAKRCPPTSWRGPRDARSSPPAVRFPASGSATTRSSSRVSASA